MKEKRLDFDCWNCHRIYSMTREIVGNPQIIVACPYCGEEGVVELDKFRSSTTEMFQNITSVSRSTLEAFNFPDVIPTAEITDQES